MYSQTAADAVRRFYRPTMITNNTNKSTTTSFINTTLPLQRALSPKKHHQLQLYRRKSSMIVVTPSVCRLVRSEAISWNFFSVEMRCVSVSDSVSSSGGVKNAKVRAHAPGPYSYNNRMFTSSSISYNMPKSTGSKDTGNIVHTTVSEIEKDDNERERAFNDNQQSTDEEKTSCKTKNNDDTSTLNQRATNAILSQLSSPPNILTMSRIVATPYLSYLLISHDPEKSLAISASTIDVGTATPIIEEVSNTTTSTTITDAISTMTTNIDSSSTPAFALSLFLLMAFTDFLDGYIARTFPSTATVLGTYLDPFADKFFISIMSLTMWYTGSLPGLLVGLWVARDVGIVGSVYWLVKRETVRKRESKDSDTTSNQIAVMDPVNTPLKVQASFLSKVNTTLQIGLIALCIAGEVPAVDIPHELMTPMIWITAGTTIGSSLGYLDGSALKKSGNK